MARIKNKARRNPQASALKRPKVKYGKLDRRHEVHKVHKVRRRSSYVKTGREMMKLQNSLTCLIKREPLKRMVRDIVDKCPRLSPNIRIKKEAFEALQEVCDKFLHAKFVNCANMLRQQDRETLRPGLMKLAVGMKPDNSMPQYRWELPYVPGRSFRKKHPELCRAVMVPAHVSYCTPQEYRTKKKKTEKPQPEPVTPEADKDPEPVDPAPASDSENESETF